MKYQPFAPGEPTLQALLDATAARHNHLCPRQVLGVRMGWHAATLFKLPLPQRNKRLVAFVETDGCFADGVAIATGCELGHRTMHLMDYGKSAVTLADTHTRQAFRLWPHPAARDRALRAEPSAQSRWHAMLSAYQTLPADQLLCWQPVTLTLDLATLVSRPGVRAQCDRCGDEIINQREVQRNGQTLCRACADGAYYRPN